VKFFKFKGRGKDTKKDQPEQSQQNNSVQTWLPFKDIHGGLIYRKDGGLVAVLRVMPYNLNLQSENEKKRVISSIHEAINGQQEAFQILCIGRPVDLDGYLKALQEKTRDTETFQKRRLLQNYIQYVAGLAAGGEAMERRYYILIPELSKSKQMKEIVSKRAHELTEKLKRAGLDVNICSDQEIIDLFFTFTHPIQSAFERLPEVSAPTSFVEWN